MGQKKASLNEKIELKNQFFSHAFSESFFHLTFAQCARRNNG